jgi:hypothetical protein
MTFLGSSVSISALKAVLVRVDVAELGHLHDRPAARASRAGLPRLLKPGHAWFQSHPASPCLCGADVSASFVGVSWQSLWKGAVLAVVLQVWLSPLWWLQPAVGISIGPLRRWRFRCCSALARGWCMRCSMAQLVALMHLSIGLRAGWVCPCGRFQPSGPVMADRLVRVATS